MMSQGRDSVDISTVSSRHYHPLPSNAFYLRQDWLQTRQDWGELLQLQG